MSTPHPDSHQDNVVNFFQTLSKGKIDIPVATPGYRRWVGAILGAVFGVAYGFVSQGINKLSLPDVPYIQYPFGLAGNLAIVVLGGLAIGFICAVPESFSDGSSRASLVAVAVLTVQWLATLQASFAIFPPIYMIFLAIGFFFMCSLAAMMLLRLAIDNQTEALHKPVWTWTRIRVPVVVLALVSFAGTFQIYSPPVQAAFTDMQALIQTGLTVADPADLPADLRDEHTSLSFPDYAVSDYTLEQSSSDKLWQDLTSPDESGDTVIMAHFQRGGILACAYDFLGVRLRCRSYSDASVLQ